MKTLELEQLIKIKKEAKKKKACAVQYKPFVNAIEEEDYLMAWQTVLGSRNWLTNNNIEIPENIEQLANGKAISWHENGQIRVSCNYNNGKIEGKYKSWHENGQISASCNYNNDKREGEYNLWYENGQIWVSCNYNNDKRDGEYKSWYNNGQIYEQYTYKNGEII